MLLTNQVHPILRHVLAWAKRAADRLFFEAADHRTEILRMLMIDRALAEQVRVKRLETGSRAWSFELIIFFIILEILPDSAGTEKLLLWFESSNICPRQIVLPGKC